MDKTPSVSYIAFEGALARAERQQKRLIFAVVVSVIINYLVFVRWHSVENEG